MRPIKTIMHPTDFSENSMGALDMACSLARDRRARLVLVHVVPSPPALWKEDIKGGPRSEHAEEDIKAYHLEMERKLHALPVPDTKLPVQHLLRQGEVAEEIVRTAEEMTCDLIVMGSRGQSCRDGGLMGSVATEVSRRASCPVLALSTTRLDVAAAESSAAAVSGITR
jgi:nucleotide-binding universal stress UspA family protein